MNVPKTPQAPHPSPKPTPAHPQWSRRPVSANTEGKLYTSALVLELRGGDELLFQFYGREGWPLAEQLGTVSVGQTVLAERKLAKLSRIQKPGKKVWF
ncbi:hypothetical protein WJX75_004946 [Coccomyxa subellipsoidea]|uniref:Uncharacterized protein n=1 Tax=Coccomyxa subellipsoidea TaxID=248742 RepID=A0ABR2YMK8_9CHLO